MASSEDGYSKAPDGSRRATATDLLMVLYDPKISQAAASSRWHWRRFINLPARSVVVRPGKPPKRKDPMNRNRGIIAGIVGVIAVIAIFICGGLYGGTRALEDGWRNFTHGQALPPATETVLLKKRPPPVADSAVYLMWDDRDPIVRGGRQFTVPTPHAALNRNTFIIRGPGHGVPTCKQQVSPGDWEPAADAKLSDDRTQCLVSDVVHHDDGSLTTSWVPATDLAVWQIASDDKGVPIVGADFADLLKEEPQPIPNHPGFTAECVRRALNACEAPLFTLPQQAAP